MNFGARIDAAVIPHRRQASVRTRLEIRNGDSVFILDLLPSNPGGGSLAVLKRQFAHDRRGALVFGISTIGKVGINGKTEKVSQCSPVCPDRAQKKTARQGPLQASSFPHRAVVSVIICHESHLRRHLQCGSHRRQRQLEKHRSSRGSVKQIQRKLLIWVFFKI